jgi:hypothetical protein
VLRLTPIGYRLQDSHGPRGFSTAISADRGNNNAKTSLFIQSCLKVALSSLPPVQLCSFFLTYSFPSLPPHVEAFSSRLFSLCCLERFRSQCPSRRQGRCTRIHACSHGMSCNFITGHTYAHLFPRRKDCKARRLCQLYILAKEPHGHKVQF